MLDPARPQQLAIQDQGMGPLRKRPPVNAGLSACRLERVYVDVLYFPGAVKLPRSAFQILRSIRVIVSLHLLR